MAGPIEAQITVDGVGAEAIDLAREVLAAVVHNDDDVVMFATRGIDASISLARLVLKSAGEALDEAKRRGFKYSADAPDEKAYQVRASVTCHKCSKDERDRPTGPEQESCEHDYDGPDKPAAPQDANADDSAPINPA